MIPSLVINKKSKKNQIKIEEIDSENKRNPSKGNLLIIMIIMPIEIRIRHKKKLMLRRIMSSLKIIIRILNCYQKRNGIYSIIN